MLAIAAQDSAVTTWWGTPIECVSAFARLEREGRLTASEFSVALARLRNADPQWNTLAASQEIREQAIRVVRVHHLRTADALQLAAAIVAADSQPRTLDFVTLDSRQAEAADKEGFRVIA
jgi:uncharacterized protein